MSGQRGNYGAVREYRDDPRAPSTTYRDSTNTNGFQDTGRRSLAEVCEEIRSNISKINNGANTIDRALKSIGTERDSSGLRDKIHETSQGTNKIAKATGRLIIQSKGLRGDKQQKMQVDRLTNDFQEAVQRFHDLQQKASEKVKTAVKLGSQQPSKPLVDPSGWSYDTSDQKQLLDDDDDHRVAKLQAQEIVIEDDLTLIREREERIRELESDILDVNEIFRDLGAMISQQGDMLNDIEANVERAHTNVESGNEQLIKAAEYQKKSRKKMCCLLITFLIVAVIVTIIVVVSVKK